MKWVSVALAIEWHAWGEKLPAPNISDAVGRFMVITQPRSGSTWFVKYSEEFARCSGVMTSGEVMHPKILHEMSPAIFGKALYELPKHSDYLRYLRGVYDILANSRFSDERSTDLNVSETVRAVGFKLMYSHLPQQGPGAPVGEKGMMRNVTIKGLLKYAALSKVVVIHLHRLNHLERHISLELIRTSNLSYHDEVGAPTHYSFGDGQHRKITIDLRSALFFVRAQLRQNQHLQHFLDKYCTKFGVTCHTVAYEHLLSDAAPGYFAALRAAVGVDQCRPRPASYARTDEKGTWVPCAERVLNWSELVDSREFRMSLWLAMCQNGNRIPKWFLDLVDRQVDAHDDAPLLRLDPMAYEGGGVPPKLPDGERPPAADPQLLSLDATLDSQNLRPSTLGGARPSRAAQRPGGSFFMQPKAAHRKSIRRRPAFPHKKQFGKISHSETRST